MLDVAFSCYCSSCFFSRVAALLPTANRILTLLILLFLGAAPAGGKGMDEDREAAGLRGDTSCFNAGRSSAQQRVCTPNLLLPLLLLLLLHNQSSGVV